MKICADNACGQAFNPTHHKQVYCDDCKLTQEQKRQYNTLQVRAKENGVEFSITRGEFRRAFPEDMMCPVLGVKMENGDAGPMGRSNSPSLDKIDPTKGYVSGNIQIISKLANSMKQNATPEQILAFCKWGLREYGNDVSS